jgi:hypothetical protein
MFYTIAIFRPEDYKIIDSNPEAEDNKENVDLKEEEIASKFSKSFCVFVIEDSVFWYGGVSEQYCVISQRLCVFNTAVRTLNLTYL